MVLDGFIPWPDEPAARYRRLGYWQDIPLGDLLHDACATYADRTALVAGDRRVTYTQLSTEATWLAARFRSLGVAPGDRVVVHLPNVPEFAVTIFALFRIGAIPVLALPGHRKVEIVHLARLSGATCYVSLGESGGVDHRALTAEVRAEVPGLKHALYLPDTTPGDPGELPAVDPAEPALLLLSGGSTGMPKLIPRTHNDYAYNVRACAEATQVGADSTYLAVNPVAHNAALGCPGLLGTLLQGGKVVLCTSTRPDEAFALIERENVTLTTLVPPLVRMWMDAARRAPVDLSGLLLQVGSSKFDPPQARAAVKLLGCRLTQWFGVGEGMLTYTRLDDPEDVVYETEGRPMCGDDEILVVGPDGEPVPDGQTGELLCRGPYTIRGYFQAPEANARAFTPDGYFHTGDLVTRRPDGNIVVVGRIKDVINRAGDKVPAEEVEEHLLCHTAVRDAAVVGVPDPKLGERTYAFVILTESDVTSPALKSFLRDRGLAGFKIPDRIKTVTELPRTAVGKVDKTALRSAAATDQQR
jgi:2,3-dihydroxybenzoate-AMP ligase